MGLLETSPRPADPSEVNASRFRHGEGDLRGALKLTAGDVGASKQSMATEVAPTTSQGERTSEAQGPSTPE